jgi:acyl carrier protein
MGTKQIVINCLKDIGVFIDDFDNDIDLREYLTDSLLFITAIVEFEKSLNIEIPDEMLIYDKVSSLNSFVAMLDELAIDKTDI